MVNGLEERTLTFYMKWMEDHVDERGAPTPPGKFLLATQDLAAGVRQLYSSGYLRYNGDDLWPTAKAQAWWIRRKNDSVRS